MLAIGIWAKISFFKRPVSAYLCAAQEGHRDRERTRQISQFLPRSKKHPRKSHTAPSLSQKELRKRPWKVCPPEGRDGGREEGQNAGVKNPQKPKAFTLVFNGCDWTVGFRGELKWRSRRNGKTHQNEIQDSDRPWRRRKSLEKIRIYFISLSARIHKCFFFLPSAILFPRTRVHPCWWSPHRPPFRHPSLRPVSI